MVETEQGLISLLITSAEWDSIYDILIPEAFENEFCRYCYDILLDEHKNKIQHDLETLTKKLLNRIKGSFEIEITTNLKTILDTDLNGFYSIKSAEALMNEYNAKQVTAILSKNQLNGANIYEEIDRISRELQNIQSPAQVGMNMTDFVAAFDGKYFSPKEDNGIKTGFVGLDEFITIDGGDMVVIGARPAVGKTAFAIQMSEQIADQGKKVLVFNLEMVENQIFERMLATETGFSLTKIKRSDSLLKEEIPKYKGALEKMMKRDLIFITGSQKASDIRMNTRRIKPDVVIIDYLQLVRSDAKYSNNRYAEVGQISHDLKQLAVEMKIPVIVLTQLNRISKDTTEPSMNEIRESGDIEQDASVILLLWNTDEADYSKKGIKIDKNRQGQLNKWTDRFIFDGNSMRFVDTETFHEVTDNEFVEIPEKTVLPIEEKQEIKVEEVIAVPENSEVKVKNDSLDDNSDKNIKDDNTDGDTNDFDFIDVTDDDELPFDEGD